MKLDITKEIKTLKGKPINLNGKEANLKEFLYRAALFPATLDGKPVDQEETLGRYHLAKKILESQKEVKLTAEEAVKLKELTAKSFDNIELKAQIYEIIDNG